MLGKFPLPVEVIPFAQPLVAKRIAALGATVKVRQDAKGNPFVSDEGHHILDCSFGQIPDPPALARLLSDMPGVVEHGLFIDLATVVLMRERRERHRIPPQQKTEKQLASRQSPAAPPATAPLHPPCCSAPARCARNPPSFSTSRRSVRFSA